MFVFIILSRKVLCVRTFLYVQFFFVFFFVFVMRVLFLIYNWKKVLQTCSLCIRSFVIHVFASSFCFHQKRYAAQKQFFTFHTVRPLLQMEFPFLRWRRTKQTRKKQGVNRTKRMKDKTKCRPYFRHILFLFILPGIISFVSFMTFYFEKNEMKN